MSADRRRHARVAVEITCTLKGPSASAEGLIMDVSNIGAKVQTEERVTVDDDSVTLLAEGLEVSGRVMYARERDGVIVSGIQFLDLDALAFEQVSNFVANALEGDGGGKRAHPRIQHRVQVMCRTPKRAKGMLHDISKGGMRVLVEGEIAVGDQLTAEITVGKLKEPLVLVGEVVRVKSDEKGEKHLAGVKLGDVPEESQALLDKLLAAVMKVD